MIFSNIKQSYKKSYKKSLCKKCRDINRDRVSWILFKKDNHATHIR